MHPPQRTATALKPAAERAMARAGRGEPRRGPHRIEVEFDASHLAQAAAVAAVEQIGVRKVGFDAPDMTEAMQAFKVVTAIAAGAVQGIYG